MNRLQKKCFLGSAGIHGLLLVLLFVGPGFLSSDRKADATVIEFIPDILIPGDRVGGGDPAAPPAPQVVQAPPPPAPEPQPPEPEVKPEPRPEPVKTKAPEPEPAPEAK